MKLGFTGTRQGMTPHQKEHLRIVLLSLLPEDRGEFHHGDCVGADAEAHKIALECGWPVVIHPPIQEALRAFCVGALRYEKPAEYMVRNHHILLASNRLIAAPKDSMNEVLRSGTWATIRMARRMGMMVLLLNSK